MTVLVNDHARIDERSLALHRLVRQKLLADPAALHAARRVLARWQSIDGVASPTLDEWAHILSGPLDAIAALLVERSERATRLRQSSPFCGILTDAERAEVYESYATGTYHPGGERDRGRP